jgi:solute carrier family 25 (mitochondrial thiamine pyrophosphate transporter), member 19
MNHDSSSKGKREEVMNTKNNGRDQNNMPSSSSSSKYQSIDIVTPSNINPSNNTAATTTQIYPQWHNFVAGGIAGLCSRIVTAPLDLIRIRRQLHHTPTTVTYPSESIWTSWIRIVQNEGGISALYRGNMSAMYLWITYAAVQFSIYNSTKDQIQNYYLPLFAGTNSSTTSARTNSMNNNHNTNSQTTNAIVSFCSGAIAGLCATIITYPFDVCRTTFSAYGLAPITTATDVLSQTTITSSSPIKSPIVTADAGAALTQPLANQPRTIRSLPSQHPLPLSSLYEPPLFPSSSSTTTSTVSSSSTKPNHPIVPIPSTVQSTTIPLNTKQFSIPQSQQPHIQLPRTFLQFVQQMYQLQGLRGFYAGVTPAIIQIIPYMGCNFAIYDYLTTTTTANNRTTTESNVNGTTISIGLSAYAGSISGAVSKMVVYPLDTVKRRLQAQAFFSSSSSFVYNNDNHHYNNHNNNHLQHSSTTNRYNQRHYTGMVHCIQTIIRDEGYMSFYRGIVPSVLKTAIATSLTFATFRWTQQTLQYTHDYFVQRPSYEHEQHCRRQ